MYQPKYSIVEDRDLILKFLQTYDFGLLISEQPLKLTHLPFMISENWELFLHVSKANVHWKDIEGQQVKFVVSGPDGYINPGVYSTPEVPTWNYAAVHLTGDAHLLTGSEHENNVMELVSRYQDRNTNWNISEINHSKIQRMLSAVVSIKINITDVDAKFKLSQNRTTEDQKRIIEWLCNGNPRQQELGQFMRKHLRIS